MIIKLKVKDRALLEALWKCWEEENTADLEDIQESGGVTINEPLVQAGIYETSTGKGRYTLNEDVLTFEGFRNSFGQTKFFSIEKDHDLKLCSDGNSIGLEKISYETSQPEKPFWVDE